MIRLGQMPYMFWILCTHMHFFLLSLPYPTDAFTQAVCQRWSVRTPPHLPGRYYYWWCYYCSGGGYYYLYKNLHTTVYLDYSFIEYS